MKKTIISLGTGMALILMLTLNSNAQNSEGDITVGGGLGYGFDIFDGEIGLNLNGYYSITDDLRAGLDIFYYLDDVDNFTAWELNALVNYFFVNDEEFGVYALGGLHRFNTSTSGGGMTFSGSSTGIMLGLGFEYNLDPVSIYAEPRYSLVSAWGQLSITAGVRYTF